MRESSDEVFIVARRIAPRLQGKALEGNSGEVTLERCPLCPAMEGNQMILTKRVKSDVCLYRVPSFNGAMRKHANWKHETSHERDALDAVASAARTPYRGVIVRKATK